MTQKASRKNWVESCRFSPVSGSEVLAEVARRVGDSDRSVVLLDLDSTLYEVAPRTHQILQEWAEGSDSVRFPREAAAIRRLAPEQVGYSIRDVFHALDLPLAEAFEEIKAFWMRRFFTTAYLEYDRPYPMAVEFVRDLHEKGAEIVYLTGRDEPFMGEGTRNNLLRDGFPWESPRTHLLLKASPSFPDLDHKKSAAGYVRERGELVASFENEPVNLVALHDLFPDAMHVFVDTVCSDHEAPSREGLYRIAGFTGFSR